jgi:uncharacterized membrane protein
MEEFFKSLTLYLASGTEAAAAIVIGLAAIEATIRALLLFLPNRTASGPHDPSHDAKEVVRLKLGRWLALALEFELAADILRTAVAPTWDEIGQLAAIVVLRTVLNYFLQKEIDKAEERRRSAMTEITAPDAPASEPVRRRPVAAPGSRAEASAMSSRP